MSDAHDASVDVTKGTPRGAAAWREPAIRIVGGIVVVWLSLLAAVLEAFLVPLRVDGVRVPVTLLLAVVGNLTLPSLAGWLTRSRPVTLLPAFVWFAVVLVLAGGRREGDVVLAGNDWVAFGLLLVGSAAAAAGCYTALLGPFSGSVTRDVGALR